MWEELHSISPTHVDEYVEVEATEGDSTASGVPFSVFCVTVHTTVDTVWYSSSPDSGYSVDNLAPDAPTGLAVEYLTGSGNLLTWDSCASADFDLFRVYRDLDPEFTPGPENMVHSTTDTTWLDGDGTGWDCYKIAAVDTSGNESGPASPELITGVEDSSFNGYSLGRSFPNPFSTNTRIAYRIPAPGGRAALRIYDVSGRLTRTLADGWESPGEHVAVWDGRNGAGGRVASGVYFCVLEAESVAVRRKVMLLK
jgi:hypothetical protein